MALLNTPQCNNITFNKATRGIVFVSKENYSLQSYPLQEALRTFVSVSKEVEKSAAMGSWTHSCSSVVRRIWDRGFANCCSSKEEEGEDDDRTVEMIIRNDELVENANNKNTDQDKENQDSDINIKKMATFMEENQTLKDAFIKLKQEQEQRKLAYETKKQRDADISAGEIQRAKTFETERQRAYEIRDDLRFKTEVLKREFDDIQERYNTKLANPCQHIYAKHTEEILFQRYNSREDNPPSIEEVVCTVDLVPREINDTSGFQPVDDYNSAYLFSETDASTAGEETKEQGKHLQEKSEANVVKDDAPAPKDEDLWWLPDDLR